MNEITLKDKLTQLGATIQQGIDSWTKAGQIIVSLLDDDKQTKEFIVDSIGSEVITIDVLDQFERIGRKQIRPELLVADYPAAHHMMSLPFSDQGVLQRTAIDVVVMRDGDKADVLKVAAKDLTKDQCKQVFEKTSSGKGLRSTGAQKAWIESQRSKATRKKGSANAKTSWSVNGKELNIFTAPLVIKKKELLGILQMME
jgi:hypothetical protein